MTDASPVIFNPLQEGYTADPWPHFAELRALDPVHRSPIGRWFLFTYDDVAALLRDPTTSVEERNIAFHDEERVRMFLEAFDVERQERRSMLSTDPPDHTRLRRLVSTAFTPSAIAALRPLTEELVDAALDAMAERGAGEIVGDLAFPLPFDVIARMLGMPESDKAQIAGWSSAIVKTLDPIITPEEMQAAADADRHLNALLHEVIAWKREHPADDLLTALIAAEEDGDRLTTRELQAQVTLLFVAGHETTVNLIGTGIHELLRRPDQAAILRDDPSLDATAVDELLRFVSPVQFSRRILLEDKIIGGQHIERGNLVMAALGSANHDPAKWGPTAEELDVRREGAGQHLAFGSGAHYCLGASLAKLEASVAIGRFLRRFPDAEIVGEPVWNGRINLRGLDRLDVRV